MATMGALSKVRGTTKTLPYPQTEGLLADTMQKYGTALGSDSDLGKGDDRLSFFPIFKVVELVMWLIYIFFFFFIISELVLHTMDFQK